MRNVAAVVAAAASGGRRASGAATSAWVGWPTARLQRLTQDEHMRLASGHTASTSSSSAWQQLSAAAVAAAAAGRAEKLRHSPLARACMNLSATGSACLQPARSYGSHSGSSVHKTTAAAASSRLPSSVNPHADYQLRRFCSASTTAASTTGGRPRPDSSSTRRSNRSGLLYLLALTAGMIGATYAAVPLYRLFCQATGYGGTVRRKQTLEEKIAQQAASPVDKRMLRELTVQFNADVADGMPWKFTPTQREVRLRPGDSTLAFYTVENTSKEPVTGVSTYNVSPMRAGLYFNKIQCFCFEEQRLLPGEKIDMPVFFYVDSEFATDPKCDGIDTLTLSYTFFKVTDGEIPSAVRAAQEAAQTT